MPVPPVADYHDVGPVWRHGAGDQVSRLVVRRLAGRRQEVALSLKIDPEIWDTAMVNIPVGSAQPPDRGIRHEVALHILMD